MSVGDAGECVNQVKFFKSAYPVKYHHRVDEYCAINWGGSEEV